MMQEVFEKLRTLQGILSDRYEIEHEILEIPRGLTTKTELLNRMKKQYIEKNVQVEEARTGISRLRLRLADAETEREGYEQQMDQIKTQREYEALDKEIRDASEREQQLRKDILREESEHEELSHELEREEAMIAQQEEELEDEQKRIKEESQEKHVVLEGLKSEEGEITPGLNAEILFKFERIIRSKAGVGIVPVLDSVCTGCHMRLPAQFENDVRRGEEIQFCPYCSRILFFEGSEEAPVFFHDDDAGSLADLADIDPDAE